jgi:hypothetical protein
MITTDTAPTRITSSNSQGCRISAETLTELAPSMPDVKRYTESLGASIEGIETFEKGKKLKHIEERQSFPND